MNKSMVPMVCEEMLMVMVWYDDGDDYDDDGDVDEPDGLDADSDRPLSWEVTSYE